jgi:hypothetical protein
MGFETDKRFNPSRFRGAPAPRKYADTGRSGGSTEASRKAHDESDAKNQYRHPVRVMKDPLARME